MRRSQRRALLLAAATAGSLVLLMMRIIGSGTPDAGRFSAADSGQQRLPVDPAVRQVEQPSPDTQNTSACLDRHFGPADSAQRRALLEDEVVAAELLRELTFKLTLASGERAVFKAFKSRREQAILGMPEWNEIVAHHISQHLHVGHTPFTAVRYVGFSVLLKAVRSKPGLQPGEGQELQRLLTDQRIHSRSGWLVRGAISAWLDNLLDVSRKPASAKTDMLVRNLHQDLLAGSAANDAFLDQRLARPLPEFLGLLFLDFVTGNDDRAHNMFLQCTDTAALEQAQNAYAGLTQQSLFDILAAGCRLIATDNERSFPLRARASEWQRCTEGKAMSMKHLTIMAEQDLDLRLYYHPAKRASFLMLGPCKALGVSELPDNLEFLLGSLAENLHGSLLCERAYSDAYAAHTERGECLQHLLRAETYARALADRLGECKAEANNFRAEG